MDGGEWRCWWPGGRWCVFCCVRYQGRRKERVMGGREIGMEIGACRGQVEVMENTKVLRVNIECKPVGMGMTCGVD